MQLGEIRQLLQDSHLGIEAALLGHVAEAPPCLERDRRSAPVDLSRIGGERAHHDPHRGGLAGAIGANESEELAGPNIEAQVAQGHQVAVAPRQSVDLERAISHGSRNLYLTWIIPMQFLPGSMNHAIQAKPMSATPSTVLRPGVSYSSILTPRWMSSPISAWTSFTRQAACVCSSLVPTVLLLITKLLSPPHLNVTAPGESLTIFKPTLLA